jgi:hypothetical protein
VTGRELEHLGPRLVGWRQQIARPRPGSRRLAASTAVTSSVRESDRECHELSKSGSVRATDEADDRVALLRKQQSVTLPDIAANPAMVAELDAEQRRRRRLLVQAAAALAALAAAPVEEPKPADKDRLLNTNPPSCSA